jgi:hypothetical protein
VLACGLACKYSVTAAADFVLLDRRLRGPPSAERRPLPVPRRLLMACTIYRQNFGEWPSQAGLAPEPGLNAACRIGQCDSTSKDQLLLMLKGGTDALNASIAALAKPSGALEGA